MNKFLLIIGLLSLVSCRGSIGAGYAIEAEWDSRSDQIIIDNS